ncbi:hypothetical protein HMPREF1544_10896 [Mucor circinelloides 1006PhL]|uniref:BHLH domain-containing protein n=1 Tax=Mucor circinelloides f. circinelloides (strain 1006PhL) TaxID=1220926 RepID=S2IYK3_MUCC1|nr:hypothetical protein HMPREF1544_10896 [Mucor circinelloides 1006PhL]
MDFSSFDLQDDGDLFKQNFQLNSNNNNNNSNNNSNQIQDDTDFFDFIGENSAQIHSNLQTHQHQHQQHPHGSYSVPQLSPDGQEGSFTNSSILSGHNPEFNMSPLQIASHNTPQNSNNNSSSTNNNTMIQSYHTPMQHPVQQQNMSLEDFQDEEEFFTPLVSPAMAPTYNEHTYQSLNGINNHENIFSPLSSPALNPSPSIGDQSTLQQKLAFIERQQQQLRNMHNQLRPAVSKASPILKSTNGYTSPLVNFSYDSNNNTAKMNTKKALQQKIAMSSPQFNGSPRSFAIPKSTKPMESPLALKPLTPHTSFVNKSPAKSTNTSSSNSGSNNGFIAPATPSLLMKLGGGGNNSNSDMTSSPSSVPTISSSSAVDNMPVLPAAMLEDTSSSSKSKPESSKRRRISQQSAAFSSPGLSPNDNNSLVSPAGPRPQQSPRALKPLISPSLHPNGKRLSTIEEETARALLTSKSNYENLKEGKAKSLGIDFNTTIQSGIENRRSAHKAAEQKRRDTLKQSFDSLRTEIIEAMVEEEAEDAVDLEELRNTKEKDVKQMSKVVLLQHSYEYILRLKSDNKRKDEKQVQMRQELMALRKQLGLPEVTDEEKALEEKEKQDEKDRKEARLQRLETAAAVDEGSS